MTKIAGPLLSQLMKVLRDKDKPPINKLLLAICLAAGTYNLLNRVDSVYYAGSILPACLNELSPIIPSLRMFWNSAGGKGNSSNKKGFYSAVQ